LLGLLLTLPAFAQSADRTLRRELASLRQDVQALRETVGSLQLEIESLQRQNERLRGQVNDLREAGSRGEGEQAMMDARIADLRSELRAEDARSRKEIVAEVTRQINDLAARVRTSLERVAGAGGGGAGAARSVEFSDDYPETGISYLVEPGDTLSQIAAANDSRVSWIRDANRIVNAARDLRAGETIFVPQEP
jgi:signal transduction histidine kinase